MDLNAALISRYELVEMMYKDQFENTIKSMSIAGGLLTSDAYVRIMAGSETDEQGRPKYRIQRIVREFFTC